MTDIFEANIYDPLITALRDIHASTLRLHFEMDDPEEDFMVIGVSGRATIEEINAALDKLQDRWDEEEE